jgi:membrane fusion protein, multidrug efflux system
MKSRAKLITRIVLIVLITAVAALITVNILFKGQDSRMGGPPPGANTPSMNSGFGFDPEASNIVSVNVIKTEKNKIEEYIKTNGDVLSKSSVNIYPDTSGRLVELYVSLGEYIRKGQIIGEVDPHNTVLYK